LTQLPPHSDMPLWHAQLPPLQPMPLGQVLPQAPQCWALFMVLTHVPLHDASPDPQSQLPALQL
jgi:hypothetical protein